MTPLATSPEPDLEYPDSDGMPMAENTLHFLWIMTMYGNLDLLFHNRPDVFVAGDNFWYPVKAIKGEPTIRLAPDVYVVFGRPKGHRGSYLQWEEGGTPLSVVFEVLSPGNTVAEMDGKFEFYERYGVQEYYIIDPVGQRTTLEIFEREGTEFAPRNIKTGATWVSPLMGVRFVVTPTDVELHYPDGKPFLAFAELGERHERTERALESERQRAARLAAKLRELGVDPDAV